MSYSPTGSYPTGLTSPTDKRIGDAFPIIEEVYKHLPHLKYLAENANSLVAKQIELRGNTSLQSIEWAYQDTDEWFTLIAFTDLTGGIAIDDLINNLSQLLNDAKTYINDQINQSQALASQTKVWADYAVDNIHRIGYDVPVAYSAGLVVNHHTFTVDYNGVLYSPLPSKIPFTTGAWDPSKWTLVQNTESTNQVYQFPTVGAAESAAVTLPSGSAIVVDGQTQGHAVTGAYVVDSGVPAVVFQDYSTMTAYTGKASLFQIKNLGIAGVFSVISGDSTSPGDGGTIFVLADGRRVRRLFTGPVNVKWFGAKGDGISDDTAAVQAAINASRDIFAPSGTYVVDTLYFPDSESDANPVGGRFVGTNTTIFQQRTENTAIFRKSSTSGRLYNWTIGPFCVQPKAGASSTASAVYTSGMTSCTFDRIQGLSNGSAGMFAIFDCAAHPGLSYFNTFEQPTLEGQAGWTKVFHFNNNGQGTISDSNANTINQPNIYNNTGLVIAIDAIDSYAVTINQPYIEANAGCLAINMGLGTVVNGGALEQNGNDFGYLDSRSRHTTVIGTFLANARTTVFGTGAVGNLWINVLEATGNTWVYVNSPDSTSNRKISMRRSETPPSPVLILSTGGAGTIYTVSSVVSSPLDTLTGEVTYRLQYAFEASGTSTSKVMLSGLSQTPGTPAFIIKNISWGAISAAGSIAASGLDVDGGLYFVPPTASTILINCLVTYKQPTD